MVVTRDANEPRSLKRKRQGELQSHSHPTVKSCKRPKKAAATQPPASHALLSQYYHKLQTLRDYVVSKLPSSSRQRRKKILSIGHAIQPRLETPIDEAESVLSRLLDNTLVGTAGNDQGRPDSWWDEFLSLSQRGDESYVTLSDEVAKECYPQAEVSAYNS